jgi:hypothetical protein
MRADDMAGNGPSRYCSRRRTLPLESINEGSRCVWMTWRATSGRPYPNIGFMRMAERGSDPPPARTGAARYTLPPRPAHSFPDCWLTVYRCTYTHSPHPAPGTGALCTDIQGTA